MKAYLLERAHHVYLTEKAIPPIKNSELLLKVGAAAICHSDFDAIDGLRTNSIKLPVVLGHEFAGTVVEVGPDVYDYKPGDQVAMECMVMCNQCKACFYGKYSCQNYTELGFMIDGGFAEYVAVPATNAHVFHNISMIQAATVECAGNAFTGVDAANIIPGDNVVVIGPGPVGQFAAQFARLKYPNKLIMVGTRDERLEKARPFVTDVVNVRTENAYEKIMDITGGYGADAIIQCATTADAFSLALDIAAPLARITIEGILNRRDKFDIDKITQRGLTVQGQVGVNRTRFAETLWHFENGMVDPDAVISHVMKLDDIDEAFRMVRERRDGALKVVIQP